MLTLTKKIARSLPTPLRAVLGKYYGKAKANKAREVFKNYTGNSGYLPAAELESLMGQSYLAPGVIRYDDEGLINRAEEKLKQLKLRVPLQDCQNTLELGCMDAMVAAKLAHLGKKAHGLDLCADNFDPRAKAAGVELIHGDVAKMPLPSDSMDLIYSFAAFEHFDNPKACLSESLRVLKKSGILYLFFGPVYTSPYGRHAYRQIPVPYCHYLFSEEDLKNYAHTHKLNSDWPYVNGVTVSQYRAIWDGFKSDVDILYYKEHSTGGVGAELITRYPACFKTRVVDFEDLLVSGIELVWRKK